MRPDLRGKSETSVDFWVLFPPPPLFLHTHPRPGTFPSVEHALQLTFNGQEAKKSVAKLNYVDAQLKLVLFSLDPTPPAFKPFDMPRWVPKPHSSLHLPYPHTQHKYTT